jgi:hypothetical protein
MRAVHLDAAGICLAWLCLVHCLALPLVVAALPVFANILELPEAFHLVMVSLALPLSGFALANGFARHHRPLPLLLGTSGLALMTGAVALEPNQIWETGLTVSGSLMLAASHLWNWRLHGRRN